MLGEFGNARICSPPRGLTVRPVNEVVELIDQRLRDQERSPQPFQKKP